MTSMESAAESARIRGACYRLFSAGFCLTDGGYLEPDDFQAMSELLRSGSSEAAEPVARMADSLDSTTAEELRIEYTRLFIGPFGLPAPPYGSVYLEDGRRLMGDSTIDAISCYREVGIDMDPTQQDVPDHVAVELEFMAYLVHMQEDAIANDDPEGQDEAVRRQAAFLEKHLCAWVPKFAGAVQSDSETGFYQHLARATDVFLKEDLEYIKGIQRQE